MKIEELRIINFKRFSYLTIKNIPEKAKLVVLIGANGSGKSSIFDAFEWFISEDNLKDKQGNLVWKDTYFKKNNVTQTSVNIVTHEHYNGSKEDFADYDKIQPHRYFPNNSFFGRPSIRIVPTLTNVFFDEAVISKNSDGPAQFIEFDTRFQTDVKKFTRDISKALRDPLFAGKTSVNLVKIAQQFIEPINQSLTRIFGEESSTSIKIANYEDAGSAINEPPNLIFSKGNSLIKYDLLSHGEKQVIIILLNFVIRSKYFQDTIYYIDEMDVHLNTSLQYTLLQEITENWIPQNCQLWTATHSLGFIEYARDTDHSVIIDFDNLDFDRHQTIEPSAKQSEDVFEIAISRASLSKILGNRKIVLCENLNYKFYSLMNLDDYIFTDVENSNSVFLKIKRDKTLLGLRDRDFLTDSEIQQLLNAFPNYKILRYYCFENYVYHPENITAMRLEGFDETVYRNEITQLKNDLVKGKIIPNLVAARNGYEEFKKGGIKKDSDLTNITLALESDDFETFYPYFNAKLHCGTLKDKYKLNEHKLVQTDWFKEKLTDILK